MLWRKIWRRRRDIVIPFANKATSETIEGKPSKNVDKTVDSEKKTAIRELSAEDPETFHQYHRLDRESFEDILQLISPHISKQDTRLRSSISARERLVVTLRFLATGLYNYDRH